jgi:hypothetical protein
MDLNKIANVLEAASDYIEATEANKRAEEVHSKETTILSISEKLACATGEPISDELLEKLARVDLPILHAIEKMAENKQEVSQTTLGEPGEKRDFSAEPETTKEAAAMADDRFLAWVLE